MLPHSVKSDIFNSKAFCICRSQQTVSRAKMKMKFCKMVYFKLKGFFFLVLVLQHNQGVKMK